MANTKEPTQEPISSVSFLFLSLTIALVAGIFIIKPQWEGITQQNNQIKEKQEEVEKKEQKIEDLEVLKTNYKEIKNRISTIYTALPTSEEHAELLVQLDSIASQNGVVLFQIDSSKDTKKTSKKQTDIYETSSINIQVVGDFLSIKNFIIETEKNLRILDIISISIENNPGGNILTASLKINIYYQN